MPKIMLIEDDRSILVLLSTLLQMEGYTVAQASDGSMDQVIASIGAEQPELVLLDVHLHKYNGFDLLVQLRQTEASKKVKVLMMSGLDMKDKCMQVGADDFILKPYMPNDLLDKIRLLLSRV